MKKKIPLAILPNVSETIKPYRHLIKFSNDDQSILHLRDIDENSDLFFRVEQSKSDHMQFVVHRKPANAYQSEPIKSSFNGAASVTIFLDSWLELLKKYAETETVFDDPIQKRNEDFFYSQFSMEDEDADYAPFEIPKQFLLAEYIENIKEFISDNREDFKDKNEPEILIKECLDLIEDIPSLPKNTVLKRVSTVCAKIIKNGMGVLKKFINTSSPEFAKKIGQLGAEQIINFLKNHGDDIGNLLT